MLVRATAVLERRGGYYDCFIENEVQERIECCQVSKREKDFKVDNYWGNCPIYILFIGCHKAWYYYRSRTNYWANIVSGGKEVV
jgi:hypothetical protein